VLHQRMVDDGHALHWLFLSYPGGDTNDWRGADKSRIAGEPQFYAAIDGKGPV
jgi:hypothetical protein